MFVVVRRKCLRRTPRPGRRVGSFIGLAIVTMAFLVSCVPSSADLVPAPDLFALEMNPLKFATITLRTDVEVKATVLGAATVAPPRARWYLLEYQERENQKGFVPVRDTEYVNLFLVSQLDRIGADQDVVRDRYLVVDLWHYYPTRGIKTCHQWTVWEDDARGRPTRATFRFLMEDFNNVFLGERSAPLDSHTVKHLGDFYVQTRRLLLDKVRGRPGDIAHPKSPAKFQTRSGRPSGGRLLCGKGNRPPAVSPHPSSVSLFTGRFVGRSLCCGPDASGARGHIR